MVWFCVFCACMFVCLCGFLLICVFVSLCARVVFFMCLCVPLMTNRGMLYGLFLCALCLCVCGLDCACAL